MVTHVSQELELDNLPIGDINRNTPLAELGAMYQDFDMKGWREVFPNFGIAKKTYNQLGLLWTSKSKWKATKPIDDGWDEDRLDRIGQNGNEGLHYGSKE